MLADLAPMENQQRQTLSLSLSIPTIVIKYMVETRSRKIENLKMERERLEVMTLEELRQEAVRYHLQPPVDPSRIIDAILDQLQQTEELPPTGKQSCKASGSAQTATSQDERMEQPVTTRALDRMVESMNLFMDQQRQMMEEIRTLSRRGYTTPSESSREQEGSEQPIRSPTVSTSSPAQVVSLLAPQIPEFGGSDEENVQVWTKRVDRVALVHRTPPDVVLLAASSKLTKLAKQWYEMQQGSVLESWSELKKALIKMFDRRVSFTVSMQRIEARRWNPSRESFDRYAIDKLALIHQLDLLPADSINLIINGIPQHSLRATALSLHTNEIDEFLDAMRRITFGMGEQERKNPHPVQKGSKSKDTAQKGSDDKAQRDKADTVCNYCKKKGHWKADCLSLKRKERAAATTTSPTATAKASSPSQSTAAAVAESDKLYLAAPLIRVTNLNNCICDLNALMDTGSPVTFISLTNFNKYFELPVGSLETADWKFNALTKTPINVLGKINTKISFRDFPDRVFDIFYM